ncbi:hypothetical protein, partial [Roseomonas populi]
LTILDAQYTPTYQDNHNRPPQQAGHINASITSKKPDAVLKEQLEALRFGPLSLLQFFFPRQHLLLCSIWWLPEKNLRSSAGAAM